MIELLVPMLFVFVLFLGGITPRAKREREQMAQKMFIQERVDHKNIHKNSSSFIAPAPLSASPQIAPPQILLQPSSSASILPVRNKSNQSQGQFQEPAKDILVARKKHHLDKVAASNKFEQGERAQIPQVFS
jgi:hypothetical protein